MSMKQTPSNSNVVRDGRSKVPDPRKNKREYFKDNIITKDEDDFDPKIYYYQRPEGKEGSYPGTNTGNSGLDLLNSSSVQPSSRILASGMSPSGISPTASNLPPSMNSSIPLSQPPFPSNPLRNSNPFASSNGVRSAMNPTNIPNSSSSQLPPQSYMMSTPLLPGQLVSRPHPNSNLNSSLNPSMSMHSSGRANPNNHNSNLNNMSNSMNPGININANNSMNPNYGNQVGNPNLNSMQGMQRNQNNMISFLNSNSPNNGGILLHDPSEFPTLGGREMPVNNPNSSNSGLGISHMMAAAGKQGMNDRKEFTISHDDFPALGGGGGVMKGYRDDSDGDYAPFSSFGGNSNGGASSHNNLKMSGGSGSAGGVNMGGNVGGMYRSNPSANLMGHNPLGSNIRNPGQPAPNSSGSSHYQDNSSSNPRSGQSASKGPNSGSMPANSSKLPQGSSTGLHTAGTQSPVITDRHGLLGLLSVIKMTDLDLNTLSLGTDLTTLGLNLNSPECLYASFTSPFSEGLLRPQPDFNLPQCYFIQTPMQIPQGKVMQFSDETLLYVFYSMPRDKMQLVAAVELYARDWRYHMEMGTWFMRVPNTESVKGGAYERGSFVFWDVNTWEKVRKDGFVILYEHVAEHPQLQQLTTNN